MSVKELRRDLRAVANRLKRGKALPAKARKALATRKRHLTGEIEKRFKLKNRKKK